MPRREKISILATLLAGTTLAASSASAQLAFDELLFDTKAIPPLQPVRMRDGSDLTVRAYPAESAQVVLLLVHGSGWHSRYFLPLAQALSQMGAAHVYTPDLRGHGPSPARRGDVDYIGQLEDDLADLIAQLRERHPEARIVVGGHSSGGGLAIRFAGGEYGDQADGYLLLAPYLHHAAPTMRENAGGWAQPHIGRIIALSLLNGIGIRRWNDAVVVDFAMPEEVRDGSETLAYSYRLNVSLHPRDDYIADLAAMEVPLLLIVGSRDEAFVADAFEPTISPHARGDAEFEVLADVTHMGAVVSPRIAPIVEAWLSRIPSRDRDR